MSFWRIKYFNRCLNCSNLGFDELIGILMDIFQFRLSKSVVSALDDNFERITVRFRPKMPSWLSFSFSIVLF